MIVERHRQPGHQHYGILLLLLLLTILLILIARHMEKRYEIGINIILLEAESQRQQVTLAKLEQKASELLYEAFSIQVDLEACEMYRSFTSLFGRPPKTPITTNLKRGRPHPAPLLFLRLRQQ